ncbi:hypothetical protein Sta7437_4886 (plasmid) [Stanieria cyanosphaera PCC 7437]|uniref:Uncharacterized protein n=1 Tax=Stanieria cyanosphaera (strain ATCC 29371 / PCC 7437) TaxID=111780 RepID=K9Y1V6_STAC7|nr:hypothetical protein [Stanieria cyanosphaera]AFZ38314.1 hypothetical protein Sta7437_4886 [Stanieria cyanosphaera PCC 7437]
MSQVRIHIWHDRKGRITAIGYSPLFYKVSVIPPENHSVLEIKIDEHLIDRFYQAKTIAQIDLPKSFYLQLLNLSSEHILNRDRFVSQYNQDRSFDVIKKPT